MKAPSVLASVWCNWEHTRAYAGGVGSSPAIEIMVFSQVKRKYQDALDIKTTKRHGNLSIQEASCRSVNPDKKLAGRAVPSAGVRPQPTETKGIGCPVW